MKTLSNFPVKRTQTDFIGEKFLIRSKFHSSLELLLETVKGDGLRVVEEEGVGGIPGEKEAKVKYQAVILLLISLLDLK